MSSPSLDPQTMNRLAFIRLLHQQGVDQSHLPEPLNYTCILTFHDAIELFLMLASEHLSISVRDRDPFIVRYFDGLHPDKDSKGVDLSARNGVKRITDLRNAFKHANTWPGSTAIEQSRSDAQTFFEENSPKVFGIEYAHIDMADLIPQTEVRALAKQAATKESEGEREEAMALLRQGLDDLLRDPDRSGPFSNFSRSPFALGPDLRFPMRESDIYRVLWREDTNRGRAPRLPTRGVSGLSGQIDTITKMAKEMQRALRVMVFGIDFSEHWRFQQLTPRLSYNPQAEKPWYAPKGYAPTRDDYGYCYNFLISTALRLAEFQVHTTPPPWMRDPTGN